MIAAFVVLAAVAVGIAYWAWQQQARSIRRDADRNLLAVSRLKASEISSWLAERRADAETVRGDRLLANGVADLLAGRDSTKPPRGSALRLASLREAYDYADVVLMGRDGSVAMRGPSSAGHEVGRVVEEKAREAMRTGEGRPRISTGKRMVTSASRWSRLSSTMPGAPSPPWCSTVTPDTTSSPSSRPGRVWAEGELGKGATFSFSLPVAKETK